MGQVVESKHLVREALNAIGDYAGSESTLGTYDGRGLGSKTAVFAPQLVDVGSSDQSV